MTTATPAGASGGRQQPARRGQGGQSGQGGGMLLELIDRILDKGLVIDVWARVSLLSIELLTVEARVVVASVETYLRFAEAIGNTALASQPPRQQGQGQQQGQARVVEAGPSPQQPQQSGQQQSGQRQAMPGQLAALPPAQSQQMQRPGQGQPQQAQPQQAQPQQAQPPSSNGVAPAQFGGGRG
ncbi:MAG TPA: gas vesicle structural protein GvpA [Ktedonobacterales bacterium]